MDDVEPYLQLEVAQWSERPWHYEPTTRTIPPHLYYMLQPFYI
jgi:hypothetical protein